MQHRLSAEQRGRCAVRRLAKDGDTVDLRRTRDLWLLGLTRALRQTPQDEHTPTVKQLFVYGMGLDNADVMDFHARAAIVNRIYQDRKVLPLEQGAALYRSVIKRAEAINLTVIDEWRRLDQQARQASEDLLADVRTAPKPRTSSGLQEDIECIVCMEDQRSVVYRPCKHRVCCSACADRLWALTHLCPWCRTECEEP